MKLHRPVAQAVVTSLEQIFRDGFPADKVLERALKSHRQFGARDRRFLAETTYEIVRHWRKLWFILGREPELTQANLWQLLCTWLWLGADGRASEMPPWREFADLDFNALKKRAKDVEQIPAVRESIPDWLYALGLQELPRTWDEDLRALNSQAPVILRANRLRGTREALLQALSNEGIEALPIKELGDALVLKERRNVFTTKAFKDGLFEIQDGASQLVAPFLDPQPGDRVIDACAGAGGKSLHLAALMKNKGKILSLDIYGRKLEELRKRATRGGIDIIETRVIDGNKVVKRLEKTADRLLLDVPCTGLGVLRRNPDKKWKLKQDELDRLRELQAEILRSYSSMLKPGGRMVYATCSLLPSENERPVAEFLKQSKGRFTLLEERTVRPGESGFDGFYMAAFAGV